jgi:type IV pilus assembly protein PilO
MRLGAREILFLLLLLALPVAAYRFVFEPRNQQIDDVRQQIIEKRAKLDQLRQATRQIDDLGQEIERLSEAVILFEQKLPAQRDVEVILKEVWELAMEHGLTPKSVRTDEPVNSEMYAELPLRMMIVGDFDGFYSFLLDLEKLQRITRLPQARLERIDGEMIGQIKADLVLSIFYEPRNGDEADKERG